MVYINVNNIGFKIMLHYDSFIFLKSGAINQVFAIILKISRTLPSNNCDQRRQSAGNCWESRFFKNIKIVRQPISFAFIYRGILRTERLSYYYCVSNLSFETLLLIFFIYFRKTFASELQSQNIHEAEGPPSNLVRDNLLMKSVRKRRLFS